MMKQALQQSEQIKGRILQGLPCVANVSSVVWHKSYNKFDTSIEERGGGRS